MYRIAAVWDSVEKGLKKTTFRWCIKAFPITGKAFMSSPAEADVFFVGIQNVDDRVGGQVADAFAKKPFGAEQRGADVQMRQRKIEAGCFVRDRRREEVVFIRLGDDGLGPVTAYRCPERLLIRLATGHYDKVGDVGKLQTPVPCVQVHEILTPEDEHGAFRGMPLSPFRDQVPCIGRVRKFALKGADLEPGIGRGGVWGRFQSALQERDTHLERKQTGIGLVRRDGARHEIHMLEPQGFCHSRSQPEMPDMHGIECPAEDADGLSRSHVYSLI